MTEQQAASPLNLVLGASGYIGSHLVPALQTAGRAVRVAGRRRAALAHKGWPDVEIVSADVLQPKTLQPALEGVDVAYYLVHSMAAGKDFRRLDLQAAENFTQAAAQAGVRRIVYLGGLAPANATSEHIVSRRETGEALRAGPVAVTEIRAGMIIGPGSAAFEVMRDLTYHLPLMITPRWVRSTSPPIALGNLLTYLIEIAAVEAAEDRVFDVGGPEYLTYETMMRTLAEVSGRRAPPIIPVPVLTPGLSALWLALVTAVPTNIARALIEGLKLDFVADDEAIKALVPQHLLNFREAVEASFEIERNTGPASCWTEGVFMFRNYRHDYAYYAKQASGQAESNASVAALWQQIASIGGENRYYFLNGFWTLRESMDWLIGGPGRQHGRPATTDLKVGDKIDSWEVLAVVPERSLTLGFGMRAPGAGVLEFSIEPLAAARNRVTVTAYWHPAGVWGLLYWHAYNPMHRLMFNGLARAICRRAEDQQPAQSGSPT